MCNRTDDMVHVSWMVYRLLGQWSCSSGVYHEPYAKGISQRNVYIYELFDCCDKLGLYSGILAAVSDAEEDASVGGLPISKGYYYALPVLVMGVIMLVMSAYKAIAFVITGDESICVPVEKEGGGLLD